MEKHEQGTLFLFFFLGDLLDVLTKVEICTLIWTGWIPR